MSSSDGLELPLLIGLPANRSLIALSLIMALLHFKPAPMYILDEIVSDLSLRLESSLTFPLRTKDAALDLSHTENIGRLFRTRFKGSQFIVVSLKDGLFSNANGSSIAPPLAELALI